MQLDDTRSRLDVGNGRPIYELTAANRGTCFFLDSATYRPLSSCLNSYAISHYLTPQEEEEGADVRAPSSHRPAALSRRPYKCGPADAVPTSQPSTVAGSGSRVSCAGSTCFIGLLIKRLVLFESSFHLLASTGTARTA